MLRACRRLLAAGGRIAYTTIVVAPGLDRNGHQEAVRIGPPAVTASAPDDVLLQKAHFADIQLTDITSDFLITARSWHAQFSVFEADVKKVLGETQWEERQASRAQLVRGIEEGLLRRLLVSGQAGSS